MKIVGLMPVRNEAWVLGLSARVALEWCDELIIFDHASEDASVDIATEIGMQNNPRVFVLGTRDRVWHEMKHRQIMLDIARSADIGATHIAMIDADEILTANLLPMMRGEIAKMSPGWMFTLPLYNLRRGINRFHANGTWGNRTVSVCFVNDVKLNWLGDKFHSREPHGKRLPQWADSKVYDSGGVMHLWGASEKRLLAKHALYKVTERLRWPNKVVADIDHLYSACVKGWDKRDDPAKWTYAVVPPEWWRGYEERGWMKYLDVDAESWQIAEVKRLVAEHGSEMFEGLDLFGVA